MANWTNWRDAMTMIKIATTKDTAKFHLILLFFWHSMFLWCWRRTFPTVEFISISPLKWKSRALLYFSIRFSNVWGSISRRPADLDFVWFTSTIVFFYTVVGWWIFFIELKRHGLSLNPLVFCASYPRPGSTASMSQLFSGIIFFSVHLTTRSATTQPQHPDEEHVFLLLVLQFL